MKTNVKFHLILLALLLCMGCFASCSKGNNKNQTETEPGRVPGGNETSADVSYQYPDIDYDGEEVTFRTLSWLWDMYIFLDADNTGDKLDQAVYKRNRGIERRFHCSINVNEFLWNWDMDEYINNISNSLQGNLNSWDVIYIPLNKRPDLITMGYFQDLKTIDALQLDQPWWDNELNSTFELANSLYFASSPLQLQAFDSAWAMFFNETLIRKNEGMENPRDLVSQNEWTFAKLDEMCVQGANINSSPSFYYGGGDGDQVYGIAAHPLLPDKLLFATGERYVSKNSNGDPVFTADSERFYNVVKKMADILGEERNLRASSTDMVACENDTGGYVYVFVQDRAFFTGGEIKTSRVIKNYQLDVSYGIVPLPKFDSNQTEYYTPIVETLLTMAIPHSCKNTNTVAQILDAMAFESYANVLPAYYDVLLYRGYHAEDEPIMEILRSSRGVDIAYYYGWNKTLAEQVKDRVFDGTAEITSTLTSEKVAINKSISEWLESLKKLQQVGNN